MCVHASKSSYSNYGLVPALYSNITIKGVCLEQLLKSFNGHVHIVYTKLTYV